MHRACFAKSEAHVMASAAAVPSSRSDALAMAALSNRNHRLKIQKSFQRP